MNEQATSFYGHKESGWFWYADPPPEPEEPQADQAATPAGGRRASGPAPMSVEWLRTNLPVLRDKAIDQPTTET